MKLDDVDEKNPPHYQRQGRQNRNVPSMTNFTKFSPIIKNTSERLTTGSCIDPNRESFAKYINHCIYGVVENWAGKRRSRPRAPAFFGSTRKICGHIQTPVPSSLRVTSNAPGHGSSAKRLSFIGGRKREKPIHDEG